MEIVVTTHKLMVKHLLNLGLVNGLCSIDQQVMKRRAILTEKCQLLRFSNTNRVIIKILHLIKISLFHDICITFFVSNFKFREAFPSPRLFLHWSRLTVYVAPACFHLQTSVQTLPYGVPKPSETGTSCHKQSTWKMYHSFTVNKNILYKQRKTV